MGDASFEFPLDELLAGLRELVREGNAEALAALVALVREQAGQIPDEELEALARLELPAAEPLRDAVRREMRKRGTWLGFRARQVVGIYGSGIGWLIGIVLLAVTLLTIFLGGLIGVKWLLYWLGF